MLLLTLPPITQPARADPGKEKMNKHTYTTQSQIRAAFWEAHPEHDASARKRGTRSKSQNHQNCDCRMAFSDFIDSLAHNGEISEKLAQRVTL